MKYYRKDWILYEMVANEGGKVASELIETRVTKDDPETNKHVPFIEETADGYIVKTGKNALHSTDKEHHIIFVEILVDDKYHYRQFIIRDTDPVAKFVVPKGKKVVAMAFCNLHGLFENSL